MAGTSNSAVQNLLPVQAYFNLDGTFNTFIGQNKPFYATSNPVQSGLTITNSTIDSTIIGANSPSTGVFTNITTTTGQITTQPSGATDIVNLLALQSYAAGISWKQPCAVATLANITLLGLQTIDGYTTLAGDRVLVKNQSTAANNGIYIASATAWTRSSDANTWNELVSAIAFVEYGTQAGSAWFCTVTPGGTLGTTPVTWSQFTTSATYTAGTGLTLSGYQFSITPQGTAGTYGSASSVPVFVTNASGQVTSVTNTSIAIAASQITSGTISSSLISGSYTGITGVGTLTAGTWNAGTIGVAYGGTGATTLTGYLKGNGTSAFTASTTIPTTDLSGTISNAQLANSTISGVALGSNLFSLTAGTNITFNSGTTYNGSAAITINATVPSQVYPGAGIANSTGSAWGTSYSTTGSGTVVALATSPTFVTPILGAATATSVTSGTFVANGTITGSLSAGAFSYGTLNGSDTGIFASYQTSIAGYAYMALQNTSSNAASTTDIALYNDTASLGKYIDIGINSSAYTGTGNFSLANAGYIYTNGGDLALGTYSANGIHFIVNNNATDAATVNGTTGVWTFASTITGSISGNAATATTATTATNATNTAITDNTSSSSTWYPTIVSTTTGNLPQTTSSTNLSFVPSTGTLTATNLAYTGTLTGGTGIVNLGSGQFYKDASGHVGIGTSSPATPLDVTSGSTSNGRFQVSVGGGVVNYLSTNGTGTGTSSAIINATQHIFQINGAEACRVNTSGNIQFPASSNQGIVFGNSSALTNSTLNDYETGTWTPTKGAGMTTTGTYSSVGTYVKVGQMVTIQGQAAATTIAINSGSIFITGLPFIATSNGGGLAVGGYSNQFNTLLRLSYIGGTNLYNIGGASSGDTQIYFSATYQASV